jgi:hypothetical protein
MRAKQLVRPLQVLLHPGMPLDGSVGAFRLWVKDGGLLKRRLDLKRAGRLESERCQQ